MNKDQAKQMGEEMMVAAKAIAAKYGMDVKRGSGKYDSTEYKMNSITFFEKGETSSRYSISEEQKMANEFEFRKMGYPELREVEVGTTYYSVKDNTDMKVVGWKSKNRKYPVLVQNVTTGNLYKMAPTALALNIKFGE